MKKQCKILHINDGKSKVIENDDHLFVEEYSRTADILNTYLENGWEVKQILNDFDPSENKEGNYTFYKGGIIVYLEKDI